MPRSWKCAGSASESAKCQTLQPGQLMQGRRCGLPNVKSNFQPQVCQAPCQGCPVRLDSLR